MIGVSTISTIGPTTSTSPNPTGFPAVTTSSPSLTPTSSPSGSSSSSSNTGAIVGGVIGGIAIIAVAVLGTVYLLRQRARVSPAPLAFDGESHSHDGAKGQLSDEGTYVSSSTLGTNVPPMMGYVRAFVPPMRLYLLMYCSLCFPEPGRPNRDPSNSVCPKYLYAGDIWIVPTNRRYPACAGLAVTGISWPGHCLIVTSDFTVGSLRRLRLRKRDLFCCIWLSRTWAQRSKQFTTLFCDVLWYSC